MPHPHNGVLLHAHVNTIKRRKLYRMMWNELEDTSSLKTKNKKQGAEHYATISSFFLRR